jgi:folate-binding protein YgfZ
MFSIDGYRALRSGVALVRRTDRGVVRLRGADRVSWLQGLVTNDLAAVQPGSRSYGAYLTPQGRMITDLWTVPLADALLLDVPSPLAASLAARLDSLIFAEDVQVDDLAGSTAVVEVYGPNVDVGVATEPAATAPPPTGLPWQFVMDRSMGVPAVVAYVAIDVALQMEQRLGELGAETVDLDTLDVLRVEAGVPRFGVDMTEETIPLEAGIEDRAISFTKGCYVGQEVIVRVTQRGGGRVAKKLVGLTVEGADVPPAGAPVRSGGREIGRVTSAVTSPLLDRVIALGYVHRDFVNPGTAVQVVDGAQHIPAIVTALPFVAPAG